VIDVQIATTSAAHDRLVQKITLTAIVDQAHNFKLEATPGWRTDGQAAVRPTRSDRFTGPPQVT
jgi:hypothetical protein